MQGFSVIYRNYGHWDICDSRERLFRIRGGPGKHVVLDERQRDAPKKEFKTVNACMSCICDELMFELIVAEGQTPHKIASWNM